MWSGSAVAARLEGCGTGGAAPSAVMLLVAMAHRLACVVSDVVRIQGNKSNHHDVSVFHNQRQWEQHGKSFGFPAQVWRDAVGAELADDVAAKDVFVGEMRYCYKCLEQGWHTAMFQHVAVRACPVHGTPLLVGCLECGKPLQTSTNCLFGNHNFCWSCGYPFVLIERLEARLAHGVSDQRAFQRLHDALVPPEIGRSSFKLADPIARFRRPLLDAHRISIGLHRSWPTHLGTSLRMLPERLVARPEEQMKPTDWRLMAINERARAVWELQDCIEKNGASVTWPRELASAWGGGVRLSTPMCLAAAALVRTVVQLSLQKVVVERGVEWNGTVQTCYMEWLPKDPPGTAYGARMQVYNLFVLNCLRIRRLRWIEQVSWNEPFEPSAFSAPWRWVSAEGEPRTAFRCRSNFDRAARLLVRYKGRWLQSRLEHGSTDGLDLVEPDL